MGDEESLWKVQPREIQELMEAAWLVRERAYIIGPTKVGCAVRDSEGGTVVGCNVEHRFRSHDVHAEVNAISNMISVHGHREIVIIAIAAERERFTPCGSCMDWILQFASTECIVVTQSKRGGPLTQYTARELMPFYPY